MFDKINSTTFNGLYLWAYFMLQETVSYLCFLGIECWHVLSLYIQCCTTLYIEILSCLYAYLLKIISLGVRVSVYGSIQQY